LLTSVKVSFLNKKTNETGVFSTNNSEGIETFQIFNNKKETGFRKANALMGKNAISSSGSLLSELGENPIYIINGKKYTNKDLGGKNLDITSNGISILLAEEATAKFGEAAKDGAIIANNARIFESIKEELKSIDKQNIAIKKEYLQIDHGKTPSLISLKANIEDSPKKQKNIKAKNVEEIPGDPIYILNGEITKKEIIDLIDKDLIESVNVLKGESAVSLYGQEAKDGAVIITTKVLDKEKDKVKNASGSINIQYKNNRFKKRTDYQIMTGNSFSYSSEDINAFQKHEKKPDSDETTGYGVKAKIFTNGQEQASPLVIIDGKKKTAEFMKKELQPENIEKINVLKGKGAIEKYGEEAEDGVIEITTKKDKEE
jgi:TonB-dependent SusC/RagA subfamily outer membrane receptor